MVPNRHESVCGDLSLPFITVIVNTHLQIVNPRDRMPDYHVFVTRGIPEIGLNILRKECKEVTVRDKMDVPEKSEIISGVQNKEALLCLLTDQIDQEVMDASENLEIISNYAVGYDNIEVPAATERGIRVTNTPGVLTDTTADMAWALIMSCARRVVEADEFVRAGRFKRWESKMLLGYDVHGKTLGIIGLGRIGSAVARRAKGFDMKVVYSDVERASEVKERDIGANYVDLDTLIEISDFISLHTPLTHSTRHLIGREELDSMKPSTILVNTSRGPVVDENALAEALEKGGIAAAGLDVFENEPEVSQRLIELSNAILTPHIASGSIETRNRMSEMAAQNIIAAMKGERPPNLVNPEVLG